MRNLTLLVLVAAGCAGSTPARQATAPTSSAGVCTLSVPDSSWLSRAIGQWQLVGQRALELEPAPLPLLILFDTRCVYHVTVAANWGVTAGRHGGRIDLPNGRSIPPMGIGITSPGAHDSSVFLALALPDAWHADPRYGTTNESRASWEEYLITAFSHEMTHARMLPAMLPRLRAIEAAIYPDSLEDNLVQNRFGTTPAFAHSVVRETQLFARAVMSRSREGRIEHVRAALALMRERRTRYFVGELAAWGDAEQVFLDLEGVAQWTALHVTSRAVTLPTGDQLDRTLQRFRSSREFWSEDEGLLMILALESLVPDWQRRLMAAGGRSAYELLDEATSARPRS
jgi:hypothetical protein